MASVKGIREALEDFQPDDSSSLSPLLQKALYLARLMQIRAAELITPPERRQQAELDRLLSNPGDKATLVLMTDQAFRSGTPAREVEQLSHILDVQGIPRCFTGIERTLLRGFQSFGGWLPGVAAPLVKERLRHETSNVVLPAEPEWLSEHLVRRHKEGLRMNVNFLGEAILSEADARRRLEQYLEALQMPEAEVFSVKISTIFSQINPLARENTLSVLCDRLETLYRTAERARFRCPDGELKSKFVYLDMEEYRDLIPTAEALMRTLDRPGLESVRAGIALQAYLPDSFAIQKRIIKWAERRVAQGGSPVTIRLVKGANMEMERVHAAETGWPQAPFSSKSETDANFKRMLELGMEHLDAVRLGIASHNLFDVTYGLALAHERDALDYVQFEMLEGMANHQRRALHDLTGQLLLYAPACRREDFVFAIGYLIRRLDENTGPENFLRHTFRLTPDSNDWNRLRDGFLNSFKLISTLSSASRRTQNRRLPPESPPSIGGDWHEFHNEPDTDWALPDNADWAEEIMIRWQAHCAEAAIEIPITVAGREIFASDDNREERRCSDPSRPGVIVGRYPQAKREDIERALDCAVQDPDGWRHQSPAERQEILGRVATEIRTARSELIGSAIADGGKTVSESDPEVSEAIDFVEFYAATARWFAELAPGTIRSKGKGVVVVASPWNFPIAIPCGGIAAGLAAGNTVILKPASDTVLPAFLLCQCFWRAGISNRTLQFLPCRGEAEGQELLTDSRVDAVILTGGTATAMNLLDHRPDLPLSAETGGKNATIVTGLADRDQAIKHVLHSAFSHAGQKCSATSLLLLEAEVYEDPQFKRILCEAAASLPAGSAWNPVTKINPLIRSPRDDLERALKTLGPGESWALMPRALENLPNCWTPGIKWDVQPGSDSHLTEFFGPVLSVMRFDKLSAAIRMVNGTGYGLTSGLESLDDREQKEWREGIRAGNLYINRPTVGAIVMRQPFGGYGKSAFGPGLKAGGPNYVTQFMRFEETDTPPTDHTPTDPLLVELSERLHGTEASLSIPVPCLARIQTAMCSYESAWREEFGVKHDHFRLLGQDNFRQYLPIPHLRIRVHEVDSAFEIIARVCATRTVGSRPVVSYSTSGDHSMVDLLHELTLSWAGEIEFIEESDEELCEMIESGQTDRVRYASAARVPDSVRRSAAGTPVFLAAAPVLMNGRLELLHYVREQSVSIDYHRYGNLGARAEEPRNNPA